MSNGIDEPVVNFYDCLFHTASSHTKKQIACIVNTAYPQNKLNFMDVTCQNGLKNLCVEVIAAYFLEVKWICTNCSN